MRRVAAAALCALALLAGGVDARRIGAGMRAGAGEATVLAEPSAPVVEATSELMAHQETRAVLEEAPRSPLAELDTEVEATPNGWAMYKQCGQSWSNDQLGTAAGVTICRAGCAMSSVAMVQQTKGANMNPGTLNKWLRSNGGYVSGDLIVWGATDKLGKARMRNYYRGRGSMAQSTLQGAIKAGQGIVVNVANGGHWVLVTGYAGGSTYLVNDPGRTVGSYPYTEMSNFVVYG